MKYKTTTFRGGTDRRTIDLGIMDSNERNLKDSL